MISHLYKPAILSSTYLLILISFGKTGFVNKILKPFIVFNVIFLGP